MATQDSRSRRCRLSVAMIARNEADVLEASIESIRSIADEIAVLDTGSNDGTPALARRLGAAVHAAGWTDDFSAARNRLLGGLRGDWILWLDAGETLDSGSAAELRDFLDYRGDRNKVYMLWLEIPPAAPDGSAEQAARLRLMPRHPALRFSGRVRERLDGSLEAAGLRVDAAPGRIRRHPRQHDPDRKAQVAARNLRLIGLETSERTGRSPRLLLAAGEAHCDLGDLAAAQRAFGEALEVAEHGSLAMLEGYYGLLTAMDGDPACHDRQVTICLEALEVFPLDAQLLLAMGGYMQARNQLELAARAFQTAVAFGQVNVESWHLREVGEVAAICLASTLQLQGKDDDARHVLVEALARQPDSIRLRRHLLNLHVKHGRSLEAIRLADKMAPEPALRDALISAIWGACAAAAQDWQAALGYLQSALAAGCDDPLCLRWLAVALLSNGQTAAAAPVLRQWLEQEPGNREARWYLEAVQQAGGQESAAAPEEIESPRQFRIDASRRAPEQPERLMPGRSPCRLPDAD
jgi:tetratricopeptide (TPR) repeat protein